MALRGGARGFPGAEEREERRIVTVLFADLAGSTALGERLDPEDVRELQGELYELVNDEVERFGGVTEKFVGDAVLAVFGIPRAHEDDADRAVLTALAVRDGFQGFARRVEERHGAHVGLRIGVNTGEVVSSRESAARGELMVSGDAVNVAARLQQAAEPGEVLVGSRTHAATSRLVRYDSRGAISVKGKSAPVEAWVARAVADGPARRGIEGLSAPMIGRDEELAVLSAVASRVARERVPQLVTLFGAAGVGKSRLLAELVERMPEFRLLKGRCLPYGDGITYWPLAQVAKEHARILESDSAEIALGKLRGAVGAVLPGAEAAAVVDAVGSTIGLVAAPSNATELTPDEARGRLYAAWRRYVGAVGREAPTVLGVEDIHWASEPLLDLLDYLADVLADSSVLVVCLARQELLETRPAWGAGKQNAISLNLSPLRPSEASRLISELLHADSVLDDGLERILERADGNPFYLEEILRMLIEQGALERRDGTWVASERLGEMPIPDSVHGVIAARVDLLEAPARDALRRCSVMGRIFWPAAVGVDEGLVDGLGRRGLVSERSTSSVTGMREFTFKHALTRDVVYQTLPRSERRALHLQIAEWIDHGGVGRKGETIEIAAYHYGETLAYGEQDPTVAKRTFELLLEAGEAAIVRAAIPSARGLFEKALTLAPDEAGRYRTLLALGRCAIAQVDYERAAEHIERAAVIAEELGDPRLRSEALGWLSRLAWLAGRWDDAMGAADGAVAALAGQPESSALATALARRSQLEMLRGTPDAIASAEETIDVARRVGNVFAEVNARVNLFTALAMRGREPDSEELEELLRRARDARLFDEAYRAIVNYLWSAWPHVPIPTLAEAVAQAAAKLDGAHDVEFRGFAQYMALSRAKFLWIPTGQWERIDAELQVPATARQSPVWLLEREVRVGMSLRKGDLVTADELLGGWMERALASQEPQRILPMTSAALFRAALADDVAAVLELAETVLTGMGDGREWALYATAAIPRAVFRVGELELLRRLEHMLSQSTSQARFAQAAVLCCRGLAALLEECPDAAVPLLQQVVDLERERGAWFNAACAELDLAYALERVGDTAAEATRAQAASVLRPLGCINAIC
jgi:class 3 adenylate cyclase/tetratricopeptide (TPR) repeat protein